MKISAEKKKEILLDTFETLKNNYNRNNGIALRDLIGAMSKIDLDLAVEMWKYLIKNNMDILHTTYDFSFSIMFTFEESIGQEKMHRLVAEDSFLKNSIFHESGDLSHSPLWAINRFIKQNDLVLANELLELAITNKYKENSLYDIISDAIPEGEEISEEAFELLSEWVGKIKNKEERAKLNLKMLSLLDEDDEEDDILH